MGQGTASDAPAGAGQCARCVHLRIQENARGSRFVRCGRADHEPGFARYPRLPVTGCPGHEPRTEGGAKGRRGPCC